MRINIFLNKIVSLVGALFIASCAAREIDAPFETVSSVGLHHFIYVPKSSAMQKKDYKLIANNVCGYQKICIVHFWDSKTNIPISMPMTDEQALSKVAHFNKNKNTGYERLLLCSIDGC